MSGRTNENLCHLMFLPAITRVSLSGYPEGAVDATGYPVCAANHGRHQEEQRVLSSLCPSLSQDSPARNSPQYLFLGDILYVMYFSGSFSEPIKKFTAGNQENEPVKLHKSHFLRKTGERWASRALLCAVVIAATA